MKVKIKKYNRETSSCSPSAWYARDYLAGKTCEVLAIHRSKVFGSEEVYGKAKYEKYYFVLHPITKKPGYFIPEKECEVVEKGKVPTFNQFLDNNSYEYSKCKCGSYHKEFTCLR